ncbi:MAG: cell wall hydrolase [Sphingomonas sp.]
MQRQWHQFDDRRRSVVAAVLVAVMCLAWSALAAIRAVIAHPPAAITANIPAATHGFEAEDHFPGAAYFYATDDLAAPGAGSTGTAHLPDMPIPAGADSLLADGTIHPAPPFSTRLASATDRVRALECLATAIYYEAASEPDAGQRAVAQVILNRVRHPAFPATVCGVVYQGSEKAGCQFSFACDGAMARKPVPALWRRVMGVAADALTGQVFAPVGTATHYHTYAVTPAWNRQLVMTAAIGAHFFHRWQGWWGTPAAFSQVYRGGEPLPEPHARAPLPGEPNGTLTGLTPDVIAALSATNSNAATNPGTNPGTTPPTTPAPSQPGASATPRATTQPAIIQPAYADTGAILDRWKDAGKPLR